MTAARSVALLFRSSRRHAAVHPWLCAFAIVGVALGVSVVVAVDLANSNAERAFLLSAQAISGAATHRVTGPSGTLDEEVYVRIKTRPGGAWGLQAAPVIEGQVQSNTSPPRTLRLLGIDPFAERPFRPYLSAGDGASLSELLSEPGTALLSQDTARTLGVKTGAQFSVRFDGAPHTLRLLATARTGDDRSRQALEDLLVVDLSTAQELLGMPGKLSHIDLLSRGGAEEEAVLAALQKELPVGATISPASAQAGTLAQLTRAFRLNLTALSLLALVVGLFLIYNAVTFSVAQRRATLGIFRALGVSRAEMFGLILGEAAIVGTLGTVVGVGGGFLLAQGLTAGVTRTITDLYFVVQVSSVRFDPATLLKALGLGIGGTGLAAAAPAFEATRTAAVSLLRRSTRASGTRVLAWRGLGGLTVAGVALCLTGVGALAFPSRSLLLSYAGLFSVLGGSALLTPALTYGLCVLLQPISEKLFGLVGRMATRSIVTRLGRNAVAIAALSIAVATTVSVALMVSSFRQTVVSWLELSLQADVFIAPAGTGGRGADATLPLGAPERLAALPHLAGVSTLRRLRVKTSSGDTELQAIDFQIEALAERRHSPPYRLKETVDGVEGDRIWEVLAEQDAVLISEPFAFHKGLRSGESLILSTDQGPRPFRVVGVFFDYASDAGTLVMHRTRYEKVFLDRLRSGVALYALPGESAESLSARVRNALDGLPPTTVRSNRELKRVSLEIFDRTFTVTSVLRLLAVAVAFVGVLTALMALALERTKELAVLRALGLFQRQLWVMVTLQSALLGLIAGLTALPLGLALAWILIHAINQRSFGWSLELSLSPTPLWQAMLLSLLAALLAGLYPSWKMGRVPVARALREE